MRAKFQFQIRTLLIATAMVGVFFAGQGSMNPRIHLLEDQILELQATTKNKATASQLLRKLRADFEEGKLDRIVRQEELRVLREAIEDRQRPKWEFRHYTYDAVAQ